jgi:hypothetical protein
MGVSAPQSIAIFITGGPSIDLQQWAWRGETAGDRSFEEHSPGARTTD